MMRTKLPLLMLSASFALSGCELIVRFDPALLDAAPDATDASVDRTNPVDVPTTDVPTTDAMDATVADASDATVDVVTDGGVDVVTDTGVDSGVDVVTDTGVDAAVDTGVDTGVDAGEDTGVDAGEDAGNDADTDSGSASTDFNGCTQASAVDLRTDSSPTVTFPGSGATMVYTPSCLVVSAGQTVTFTADSGEDFVIHPLRSGDRSVGTPQAGSPIVATDTGTTATFTFSTTGAWGFYCQNHSTMQGVVYVTP